MILFAAMSVWVGWAVAVAALWVWERPARVRAQRIVALHDVLRAQRLERERQEQECGYRGPARSNHAS